MYAHLSPLIKWPGCEELRKTTPIEFQKHLRQCVTIIDCLEIFIEHLMDLKVRGQTWSNITLLSTLLR